VSVCPVDCFYEGPNFLAINPDECIDCGVCVDECPANAIVPDNDVTIDVVFWRDLNKRLSLTWPSITKQKAPLPEADAWNGKSDKLNLLEE
jgi:ferredoxin